MRDPAPRLHGLEDTTRCPLGHRCESCGAESPGLEVEIVPTPLGSLCLTLCRRCAAFDDVLPISVSTAVRLGAQHTEHVGADRIVYGDRP